MQAIFITYDLAHHENIIAVLNANSCRGFTAFGEVQGRGTKTGDPHYGTHAWPSLASAMLTVVDDAKVDRVLAQLHELDEAKPRLGLRAFVWEVARSI